MQKSFIFLFSFFLVLFLFGIAGQSIIIPLIATHLEESIVVDSPHAPRFKAWTHSPAKWIRDFYMFNITNYWDVRLNSSKPEFVLVGPYSYFEHREKDNPSFTDNQTAVQFVQQNSYYYRDDNSGKHPLSGNKLDPFNDIIININPAYLILLNTVGKPAHLPNEWTLHTAMIGPVMNRIYQNSQPILETLTDLRFGNPIINSTIDSLSIQTGCSLQVILQCWLNCSQIPEFKSSINSSESCNLGANISLWTNFLVKGSEFGISNSSLMKLWDSTDPKSLFHVGSWKPDMHDAYVWGFLCTFPQRPPQKHENYYYSERMEMLYSTWTTFLSDFSSHFQLSSDQMIPVLHWLVQYAHIVAQPDIQVQYGNSSQLWFTQWALGTVLPYNTSIQEFLKMIHIPTDKPPEVAMYNIKFPDPPMDFSNVSVINLWNGTENGLFQSKNIATFLKYAIQEDIQAISDTWGLSLITSLRLGGYFLTYIDMWLVNQTMTEMENSGSGLWAQRTVQEMLWNGQDQMVNFILLDGRDAPLTPEMMENALINMLHNDTNIQEAIKHEANASWFYTGKGSLHRISERITWNEYGNLDPFWNGSVPVSGKLATQFTPPLRTKPPSSSSKSVSKQKNSKCGSPTSTDSNPCGTLIWGHKSLKNPRKLHAWVNRLVRSIDVCYTGEYELHNITVWRHEICPSDLAPSTTYYQPWVGIWNISGIPSSRGLPVYLSKPMFLDGDQYFANQIANNPKDPNRIKYDTFMDVEPVTATTLAAYERLQVNFWLEPNNDLFWFPQNIHMRENVLYPLFYADQYVTASNNLLLPYSHDLYPALSFVYLIPFIFIPLSVVGILSTFFIYFKYFMN